LTKCHGTTPEQRFSSLKGKTVSLSLSLSFFFRLSSGAEKSAPRHLAENYFTDWHLAENNFTDNQLFDRQ
jgi:hypothetical protein